MKKISLLVLLASLILNMFAYSLYEYNVGNLVASPDARSSAMGGTGVAGGYSIFDATINPANISFLKKDCNAAFAMNFMNDNDERSLPMFNFFDSYIDNSTYANNSNTYAENSFALSYNYALNNISITAAAMYRPIVNFDASYEEQVRNDADSDANTYPPIIAMNYMDGSGAINAYSFLLSSAYSFNELNKLALGFEIASLVGSQNQKKSIIWSEFAHNIPNVGELPDFLDKSAYDYNGIMFKLGTDFLVNERINLGFSYQAKSELDVDASHNSVEVLNPSKYILPSSMRAGITFLPRNPYKTIFQLDLEKINYSEINKFLDDSFVISFGVEHYIGKAVPLRMGFRHESSMLDKSVSIPTITAGTGFNITKSLALNLSGEFSTRTYDALDLFMDSYYNRPLLYTTITPTDRGWENPDRVEERFVKIQSNLCFTW